MKSVITAIIVAAVISGSAGAASLLFDGHKLKNHSVPVTKLTASAVRSLHGQRGSQGSRAIQATCEGIGDRGAQGARGPAGPPGLSGWVNGSATSVSVAAGAQGTAISLCPLGTQPLTVGYFGGASPSALRTVAVSLWIDDATGAPGYAVTMANTGVAAETLHVQLRCATFPEARTQQTEGAGKPALLFICGSESAGLRRYVEEDPEASIEEAALAASSLIALTGAGYQEAVQTLRSSLFLRAPLTFSPQPVRHPSRERRLPGKPLRLGRRRLKRLERTDVHGRDLQGHFARIDRPDLFARHVANLCGLLGRHRQAVENVALLIAFDLSDDANDDAIRCDHVPTLRYL